MINLISKLSRMLTYGKKHHNGSYTESQWKTCISAKAVYALSQFGHQKCCDQSSDIYGKRELGSVG